MFTIVKDLFDFDSAYLYYNLKPGITIAVQFMYCDLASFRSIKKFASKFKERGLPLHILVNNGLYEFSFPTRKL